VGQVFNLPVFRAAKDKENVTSLTRGMASCKRV